MRILKSAGIAGAIAVLAITACTNDPTASSTSSLSNPEAAVRSLAADNVAEQVDLMRGHGLPRFGLPGLLFPSPNDTGAPCRREGDSSTCPRLDREGLLFTRTVTFFDAVGAVQSSFDSLLTASVNFHVLVTSDSAQSADDDDDGETRTVRNERDLTVTGLLGLETSATWNGTGTSFIQRTEPAGRGPDMLGPGMGGRGGRGGPRSGRGGPGGPPDSLRGREGPPFGEGGTLEATSTSTVDNVVVPVPLVPGAWPVSGSISESTSATITLPNGNVRDFSRTAVVTFNGTQFVPLVINGDTTIIDLAQRPLRGRFHGRPGRP